jgi:hypothetical protein
MARPQRTLLRCPGVVLVDVEAVLAGRRLVADAIAGDVSAFALLLDPLWDPAYRLAFSMLQNNKPPRMLSRRPLCKRGGTFDGCAPRPKSFVHGYSPSWRTSVDR